MLATITSLSSLALPRQTHEQARLVQRAAAQASAAAARGDAELVMLLNDSVTRSFLKTLDDGSHLYEQSAEALLHAMAVELDAAELVHSFGDVGGTGNCGQDVQLSTGVGEPYFYNQWLLQALHLLPVDRSQNIFSEAAETSFFGFTPFSNLSAPDVQTATNRPVYAALNMYRSASGNPQCGPVSAVLSRRYVGLQALAAPVDTGLFFGSCGQGQAAARITPASEVCLVCDAWPVGTGRPLGVPGQLAHLFLPYLRFYNATAEVAGDDYPKYNLARLAIRLLSRETYTAPHAEGGRIRGIRAGKGDTSSGAPLLLNFMENTWGPSVRLKHLPPCHTATCCHDTAWRLPSRRACV